MDPLEARRTPVSEFQAMGRARKETLARYPTNLRVAVSPPPPVGGGAETQAQCVVTGPDLDAGIAAGGRMVAEPTRFQAAAECDTTAVVGKPEVAVAADRNAAADLGISVADIAAMLRALVTGEKVPDYADGCHRYDVNLRALPQYRDDEGNLSPLTVPSARPGGDAVPLGQLATTNPGLGLSVIEHHNCRQQACRDRLRPVMMTTIASVAGATPLAVSRGTGLCRPHPAPGCGRSLVPNQPRHGVQEFVV